LVEGGTLSKKNAIQLAQAIHAINRRISRDVVDAFIEKVRATR
jgi:hypothetical protein